MTTERADRLATLGLALRDVGLRVREREHEPVARWIEERVATLGLRSLQQYLAILADSGEEARREREALSVRCTVGETYFFRDRGQFELLAERVLPDIIERRRAERRIRIWSAGCSTGEEAWSLAMLLQECPWLGPDWHVEVVGTDINSEALRKAEAASYGDWSFRALDEPRKLRHFDRQGTRYSIRKSLRGLARFQQLDLLRDDYAMAGLKDLDLIVCRNVFIYLEVTAIAQLVPKLSSALAEGGCLITGHGELLGHSAPALRPHVYPQSVVFHKSHGHVPFRRSEPPPMPRRSEPHPIGAASARPPEPEPPPLPAREPPDVEAMLEKAWAHANAGRAHEAVVICERARGIAPFDHWPHYLLAQLAQDRGDVAAARTALHKALYLAPAFVPAWIELGHLHDLDDQPARARQMFENARRELVRMSPEQAVAPYGTSTAGEMLSYVERRLLHSSPDSAKGGRR